MWLVHILSSQNNFTTMPGKKKGSRELTLSDRKACFAMLLLCYKEDKLEHGSFVKVAEAMGSTANTISRFWSATLSNMEADLVEHDDLENYALLTQGTLRFNLFPDEVFSTRNHAREGKKKYSCTQLAELTTNVPLNERSTYRNHAAAVGVSRMTSWRLVNKDGFQRVRTSAVRPILFEKDKNQPTASVLSQFRRPLQSRKKK